MRAWLLALPCLVQLPANGPEERCTGLIESFRAELTRFRQGERERGTRLEELGSELCRACDRCDAADVARYYRELAPEDVHQGWLGEQRFLELRRELSQASEQAPSDWPRLRERLLDELELLASESEARADVAPAAQARSLKARLLVERLDRDALLDAQDRQDLFDSADREARRSLAHFERTGQVTPRLEPRWLLARLARASGRRAEAGAAFRACADDARRAGRDDWRANGLHGLALLARDRGDVEGEKRMLLELAGFQDPKEDWELARDWAGWLLIADRAEEARDFLDEHAPPATDLAARAEFDLLDGGVRLWLGELDRAREALTRAAEGQGGEVALLALATLALREERAFEVFALLDDEERRSGLSRRGRAQAAALLGEACLRTGDGARATQELALALDAAGDWESALEVGAGGAPAPRAVQNVIGEWLGVHTLVLYASACLRTGDALEAARALEEFQSQSLRPAFDVHGSRSGTALAREDLLAWARHYEHGLVTWAIGPASSVVVHVAPDGQVEGAELAVGRTALERAGRRLREALVAGRVELAESLAGEIGAELLPTEFLSRAIDPSAAEGRLLVLLHGPLEALPIEVVRCAGRTLEGRFTLVTLPGLPAHAPGRALGKGWRWSLLGAPDTSGLAPLPGARAELEELRRLHPQAEHAIGAECTRDRFLAALASSDAVHIATHIVADAPRAGERFSPAALAIAAGARLSASEIAALAPGLECVVLSSCAGAAGRFDDAQGLQGMARAFLEAGTRNVVAALWPVEDGAAREFALSLQGALAAGEPPSRAVALARARLCERGLPIADWAAFRLLGRE